MAVRTRNRNYWNETKPVRGGAGAAARVAVGSPVTLTVVGGPGRCTRGAELVAGSGTNARGRVKIVHPGLCEVARAEAEEVVA